MPFDAAQLEMHRAALKGIATGCWAVFDAEDAAQDTMVRAWRTIPNATWAPSCPADQRQTDRDRCSLAQPCARCGNGSIVRHHQRFYHGESHPEP